jgi:hypothetical protein
MNSYQPVQVITQTGVLEGKTILSLESGSGYYCVFTSDGQAFCWGKGEYGKLGNGSQDDSNVPVAVNTDGVLNGKTIMSLAVGVYHSCAVTSEPKVYCWGRNDLGQLGNGESGVSASVSVPVSVIEPADPGESGISGVSFMNSLGVNYALVSGSGFPGFGAAMSRQLVKLNGVFIPFCSFNGVTAAELATIFNIDPSWVSDTPTCFPIADDEGSVVFTSTSVIIRLADSFDIEAPGTITIDSYPAFAFNTSPGGGDDEEETPPPDSSGPSTDQPPVTKSPTPTVTDTPQTLTQEKIKETLAINGTQLLEGSGTIKTTESKSTFSGTAPAGTKVTVTVHSDPVSCSAVADENNRWSCTLLTALPIGSHNAFIAMISPAGTTYEFGPYPLEVTAVADDVMPIADDETTSDDTRLAVNWWPWVIGAGIVAALIIIIAVAVRRSARNND